MTGTLRIVLDTGVLYYPALLRGLARRGPEVVVPAVALAERIRQMRRDRMDVRAFLDTLDRSLLRVEAFGPSEANRASHRRVGDAAWRGRCCDALIASHVREGDELWTTNPRDFLALGVPRDSIRVAPTGERAEDA